MAKESKEEFLVGVDLGGTKILAAVMDHAGRILAREKTRTRVERGVSETLQRIVSCTEKAIKKSGIPRESILAVGVGSPGPLNPDTGVVEAPANLTGWKNVPLKTILQQHLKLPVYVENDVSVGTYGEFQMGSGVGMKDIVGIFIGTGIGGGLILDGRLYQGFNKTAGEIGHMILDPDGPLCGCGRRGCYEAFASRLNVVRRIGEISKEKKKPSPTLEAAGGDPAEVRSGLLLDGWRGGDVCVIEAIREMCYYTGLAVANLINLLCPEMFIMGGGVIEALSDELLPLIEETAFANSFEHSQRNVRIRPTTLGDDACVIGAAFLAAERRKAGK